MHHSLLSVVRQDVQSMHAYAIQASHGMVKLDAMENPYSLPDTLQKALGERLGRVPLHRYPNAHVEQLKQAIRSHLNLPDNWGLMLGNGSDELISLLAMAIDLPHACILAPVPGFVMYGMSAKLQGINFVGVDLTPQFELDVPAMLLAMEKHHPSITYLAYPNNPTAHLWSSKDIQAIIDCAAQWDGWVVMDEAYQPFSSQTWLDTMRQSPESQKNVLLMRTFSKWGLAGVRLGYLTGPATLVQEIDKLRPPYNISSLNAECGLFALEHADVYANQAYQIIQTRTQLIEILQSWGNQYIQVFPSQANMVLVRVSNANDVFNQLKLCGFLVKNVESLHSLLKGCLRLTIGTSDETAQLLTHLHTIVKSQPILMV